MKRKPTTPRQKVVLSAELTTQENLIADNFAFSPSPDEVARRAYLTYEQEGSLPDRAVQHWLTAEADLIAERELAQTPAIELSARRQPPAINGAQINL